MTTVSLELSKLLKENGYPQETEFYWWGDREGKKLVIAHRLQLPSVNLIKYGIEKKDYCASPTCDEVLERLPASIRFKKNREGKNILVKKEKDERITDTMIFLALRKDYDTQEYLIEYFSNESVLTGGSKPDFSDTIWSGDNHNTLIGYRYVSLVDCAAKMWLFLAQNGLLEV